MTKTENFALPQWEAADPVKREDFNDAMAKIETALTAASYVADTYTGNGLTMEEGGKDVTLGFRPKFVIISDGWTSSSNAGPYFLAAGTVKTPDLDPYFSISATGFRVAHVDSTVNLQLNLSGVPYTYIAFR